MPRSGQEDDDGAAASAAASMRPGQSCPGVVPGVIEDLTVGAVLQ